METEKFSKRQKLKIIQNDRTRIYIKRNRTNQKFQITQTPNYRKSKSLRVDQKEVYNKDTVQIRGKKHLEVNVQSVKVIQDVQRR